MEWLGADVNAYSGTPRIGLPPSALPGAETGMGRVADIEGGTELASRVLLERY